MTLKLVKKGLFFALLIGIIWARGPKKEGLVEIFYEKSKDLKEVGTNKNRLKSGLWHEYYQSGKLKGKGSYTVIGAVSVQDGPWETFHENGQLESKVTYSIGDPQGVFISFYPDGKTNTVYNNVKGKKEGPYLVYYPNGKLKEKVNYTKNNMAGPYTRYSDQGEKVLTGTYKDNKMMGRWNHYDKGILRAAVFLAYYPDLKASTTNGECSYYDENGKLARTVVYVKGRKNGMEIKLYPNGTVKSEGFNKQDKRDGEWKSFYESGQLKSKYIYTSGLRNGPGETYFENGQVKTKGMYKHNKKDGLVNYYAEDGKMVRQLTHVGQTFRGLVVLYKDGTKKYEFMCRAFEEDDVYHTADNTPKIEAISGNYIEYHDDGKTEKITGQYKMGDKKGTWTFKDEAGSVTNTELWKMGELVPLDKDGKRKFGF